MTMAGRRRRDPIEGDAGLIGQHLAQLCADAGLSAEELAGRIGKDRDTVTLYFSGSRLPRLQELRALALALGLANLRDILPDAPLSRRRRKKRG